MHVIEVRPTYETAPNGNIIIATFDIEIADGVRLFGLNLVTLPDGTRSVFISRGLNGARHASLRKDVRERVVALVADHLLAGG